MLSIEFFQVPESVPGPTPSLKEQTTYPPSERDSPGRTGCAVAGFRSRRIYNGNSKPHFRNGPSESPDAGRRSRNAGKNPAAHFRPVTKEQSLRIDRVVGDAKSFPFLLVPCEQTVRPTGTVPLGACSSVYGLCARSTFARPVEPLPPVIGPSIDRNSRVVGDGDLDARNARKHRDRGARVRRRLRTFADP